MIKPILAALAVFLAAGTTAWAAPSPVPQAAIAAGMKKADCSEKLADAMKGISVFQLDRRLKLVEVPCWAAAYQNGSILFVLDPAAPAKARLLRFQNWGGTRLVWTFSLTSPDFFADLKRLKSFHKARGVGDCGSIGQWAWGGSDFKLTGAWVKDKCDGEPFADDGEQWRVYPPRRR